MKKLGIICEYNPFHTGHKHHIDSAKGEDCAVICLMSGNITQRGELAITDKYTRAACALAGGADLVLELPFPFSAASADYFAGAGVAILDALGTDEINFGSESADRERLISAARLTVGTDFDKLCKEKLEKEKNLGAAQAYFEVMRELGTDGELLSNDMLGVAYFRAALRLGCEDKLSVTERLGSNYSDKLVKEGAHPSATALRELLLKRDSRAYSFMPRSTADILRKSPTADILNLERTILSFFRLADPETVSAFAEAGGGLAFRLCSAAKDSRSLDEFFEKAAAKRYTASRVRRAVINSLLGVTPQDICTPPEYVLLLGANPIGRDLLSKVKNTSPIPIVTKPADAAAFTRQFELSARADALYTLAFGTPKTASEYIKHAPVIDFSEKR